MRKHARALAACLLLASVAPAGASAEEEGKPRADAGRDAAGSTPRTPAQGARPGDERGAVRFVPKDRPFYAASGGQLWYYLNLYYWAPKDVDPTDLWIRAEVVAIFRDLRKWPNASPVAAPAPKVTVEYWQVGASGRTVRIDNHKDFWLLAEDWCAGAIEVTTTLELGRVRAKGADGAWEKPKTAYVLDRKSYEPGAGIGAKNIAFDSMRREPVNVWKYVIPWSTCPARFVRSNWEDLRVPEITLCRSTSPTGEPVLTGGR